MLLDAAGRYAQDHATAPDIRSEISKDANNQPLSIKGPDGQPQYYYDVSYRSTNAASEDFAKQLLSYYEPELYRLLFEVKK